MAIPSNITDVFTFMNMRPVDAGSTTSRFIDYISDDFPTASPSSPIHAEVKTSTIRDRGESFSKKYRVMRSFGNTGLNSRIGAIIVEEVYTPNSKTKMGINALIVNRVKGTLPGFSLGNIGKLDVSIPRFFDTLPHILSEDGQSILILPGAETVERVDSNGIPIYSNSIASLRLLEKLMSPLSSIDESVSAADFQQAKRLVIKALRTWFGIEGATTFLIEFLSTDLNVQKYKADCFEYLYQLYVLRGAAPVSFDHVTQQLRTWHAMEILALDEYLDLTATGIPSGFQELFCGNSSIRTELQLLLNEVSPMSGNQTLRKYFIEGKTDWTNVWMAQAVVHPIFARKAYYKEPFNSLRPIGIGDLKVVKQWLIGYKKGEISYIHNVLKDEVNEKTFRNLQKTEDVLSFSTSSDNETTQENATTGKFEIKKEVDDTIKNDLNLSAGANLSYQGPINVNLTGNVASNNSKQSVAKTANNFAKDIMSKAISKVELKSSQQRTSTRLVELEENYKHMIENNKQNSTHNSGIYRWVDKKYKAQVYNYGKRMMFEFVIPEPADFYILSRIKASEWLGNLPAAPKDPGNKGDAEMPVRLPGEISESVFASLKSQFDLSEFKYPSQQDKVIPLTPVTGKFEFTDPEGITAYHWVRTNHAFSCRIENSSGYKIRRVALQGHATFHWSMSDNDLKEGRKNHFYVDVNNSRAFTWDSMMPATAAEFEKEYSINLPGTALQLLPQVNVYDDAFAVTVDVDARNAKNYSFTVTITLEPPTDELTRFQELVYNKVKEKIDQKNSQTQSEAKAKYEAELTEYNRILSELKAQSVNGVLQGKSEAFNKSVIVNELKKHCITFITHEFDLDTSDDVIGKMVPIASRNNAVAERYSLSTNAFVYSRITNEALPYYPTIDIKKAIDKGNYVQFLEQAFEWNQIAYVFYPYFWAHEPKWIEQMNFSDSADPKMSAFLQAGSAKVLLAVSPSYETAVMHYLATGEIWNGGTPPVIGDSLYIPIHEEIKRSQDDLHGATAEGEPWEFTVPTSLVYLDNSADSLPPDSEFD